LSWLRDDRAPAVVVAAALALGLTWALGSSGAPETGPDPIATAATAGGPIAAVSDASAAAGIQITSALCASWIDSAALGPLTDVGGPFAAGCTDPLASGEPARYEFAPEPEPLPPSDELIEGALGPGDTLAAALGSRGVDGALVDRLARKLRDLYDFRFARPGHRYRLELDDQGDLVSFEYVVSRLERYRVDAAAHGWVAQREEIPIIHRRTRIAGVVTSTLYDSIQDLGEDPQLAADFAGIFAWDVDFSRSVQPGDEFRIHYERNYVADEDGHETYIGPGRILAARYSGAGGDHSAVYYETEPGKGGYYRPDGTSVERRFLAAPLNYSRISSTFSRARFHPILKITRPHHGIDYAAPTGTPIWAVADGTVLFKGWQGTNGRFVKIRHADGYVSQYAHLSRFAPGLRVGQRVRQKQVIGQVGSSGLATGPHVCFRIQRNGEYVDPARLRMATGGAPIPADGRDSFVAVRDRLLAELGPASLVATDEAM
jgi:murein DD-endopeptidase MepM/ murein hydrolase activator NlpD